MTAKMGYATFRATKMITGFNTDVKHGTNVYHVQTEDRGMANPVLESLVYVGGTIIAKKQTSYSEHLRQGATEEAIGSLLRKQHQVIIAAIKAGRIEDLIRHSDKEPDIEPEPVAVVPAVPPPPTRRRSTGERKQTQAKKKSGELRGPTPKPAPSQPQHGGKTEGLNLDKVISDYMKRSSEDSRLDLSVLSPDVFVAGRSISLRVRVQQGARPEPDSIVTIKIIGTAFKPQVFIGRAGLDGVANFNLALPMFTAGTAAIVIEAQSKVGRGELKHLIRRA